MRGAGRGLRAWFPWTVVCVLLMVLAFAFGTHVRSPWADAVANARQGTMATAVVATASVSVPTPTVTGVLSTGSVVDVVASSAAEARRLVVTARRAVADDVMRSGDVLSVVSGRPMIVLSLPFPLYRDLHLGDAGDDVRAVQEALAGLGHYDGPLDGQFGTATGRAVTGLYTEAGEEPPATPADAVAALNAAADALSQARAAAAQDPGEPGSEQAVTAAERALHDARRDAGPWLPMAEIVAIPRSTATVAGSASVGTVLTLDMTVASLRVGEPEVTARVSVAEAPVFRQGTEVVIAFVGDADLGVRGIVDEVGEFRQGSDDGSIVPGYDVRITLSESPPWLDGSTVSVAPAVTGAEETGLLVPFVAVREDVDGAYVVVVEGVPSAATGGTPVEGSRRRVPVELGLQSAGSVIVRGDLADGDRVLVAES